MPMSRLATSPHVTQLQSRLRVLGMDVKPETLAKVMAVKGIDVDFAVTAFVMTPRPSWLLKILGPWELQER